MVFGNMGDTSATGVCFSRDAGNGEDLFNGEYLINAQGEDVVAGIRTPQQITKIGSQRWAERAGISEEERVAKYPSMEEAMPEIYKELDALQTKLEDHYRDMQDMEFTVQEGKLWFLQTRNGKRTGAAMVKIAMDLLRQGMIDEKTALKRCEPNKLDELLHPVFDKQGYKYPADKELDSQHKVTSPLLTSTFIYSSMNACLYRNSANTDRYKQTNCSTEQYKKNDILHSVYQKNFGRKSHCNAL